MGSYEEWKRKRSSDDHSEDGAYGRWKAARDPVNVLNGYQSRIDNKEYLSRDDFASFRTALDRYISDVERSRQGKIYTPEEEQKWQDDKRSLNDYYDAWSSYYKNFQDADVFDAYKTFDLERYNRNQEEIARLKREIDDIGFFENLDEEIVKATSKLSGGANAWTRKEVLEETLARLEAENAKYLGVVDPDEYARLKKIEAAPGWERGLATIGDLLKDAGYGVTGAIEKTIESIPRAMIGASDKLFDGLEIFNDYTARQSGRTMVANRDIGRFIEKGRAKNEAMVDDLNIDFMGEIHDMDDDTRARLSYLSEIPQVQGTIKDITHGVSNMVPAIAATAITKNPAVGQAVFFANAAGASAEEASLAGAKPSQAAGYGLAIGALETATEKLGGSVFGEATDLASTWFGRQLIKNGMDQYVGQGIGKAAYTIGSEGFEELIMDVVTPGTKAAFDIGDAREKYFGKDWKSGWEEVLEGLPKTFAVGGTVGIVLEGFHTGSNVLTNIATGAKDKGGLKGGLAFNKIASEMNRISEIIGSNEAVRQSKLSQEKKNQYTLLANQRIAESLGVISEKMQSFSEEQRDHTFEAAPVLAKYLNKDGTVMTEITESLASSTKAAQDSSEVSRRGRTSAHVESFDGLNEEQIREKIEKRLSTQIEDKAQRSEIANIMTEIVQGRKVTTVDIKKVTGNGYALKVLNDYLGTSFNAKTSAKEIRVAVAERVNDYSPTAQARVYAAVLDMGEEGARGLMMISQNLPVEADLGNVAQAYNALYQAGVQGKAINEAKNPYIASLDEQVREYAYQTGVVDGLMERGRNKNSFGEANADQDQNAAETKSKQSKEEKDTPAFLDEGKVNEAQAKVDAAKRSDGKKKKGAVIYDGDRGKLSGMQKKSLDVLDKVSEALGVTLRIYESERVNGKFVYEKPDGVKTSANGWYDPKTGEIWLDINAGLNGEGTLIFTAAHELTHFIKQWSPKKFKIFADFLIEQYGERGISIDELVRRQIDKAKKNGREISRDEAYEEVIADSCETFLRDSNAVEKIVELNQKDASLAQKIKQFLRDMFKRLRELMKGMDPDSLEGKVVAEMTGSLEQLHKLWTDALADAGEAYSRAESDTTNAVSDSEILYAERDYPIDSDVQKTVKIALSTTSSTMHELGDITAAQNNAINRLVNQTNNDLYRGKFTGGKHLFSDDTVKHIIKEHGDFLREGLRAQLPMNAEDIARHLSAVKANKMPNSTKASKTKEGKPSILTSYEVNGYTLYAEEITKKLGNNLPSDLIGHTMYKAPTLPTAAFNATSARTQPKRQSVVLCNYYTSNGTNLSTGNFIQNSNGLPGQLNYISVNGVAKQDSRSGGLIALSSNASNFTDTAGTVEQGYVRCNKPFYITADNRVFSNSDTNVSEKISDLKKQGYDCFIFEKTPGDNYMVAVVNKAQIIKNKPTVVSNGTPTNAVSSNSNNNPHSDRDYDAPTNREILANLLESEGMSPSEKGFLTKYKNKIAQIEANEAEISEMESELKELRKAGKKDSSRAITLEGKIEARRKEIARDENMILNLESTNSIKRLLKREKDAAYAEGMLAGQMAQGRRDAAKLRESEEKLAEQKRKDGETLAEYRKRVAEREAEIKQKNRERLAEQREKARENLDAQAKRYQESRKKATEGRHKTVMRHKIADVVSELDKLLRKGTKERNVKIGLQDAVASALELFDMNEEKVERYNKAIADLDARIASATDPVDIEALTALREKKVRNSERLADKLQVMKKAYEDIHNGRDGENYPSYYKAECEAIENRIAEVMEKVGDTPIGDMSLEQLESVYDMYRMVLTTVQNANKIFKEGKLADLTEDAVAMTAELQRIKKLAEERLKAGDGVRGFVWNELTPYYAFNLIGSETLMSYYEELIRGQDVYARDIEEAQKFAEDTRKKHGYSKWQLDQVHSFKDKDGRDFRLTLRHMMSIYAYSKREQAFDHMEKGGFFFNNKETFRTDKTGILKFVASNESGYKVDARVFAQIKGALTEEQIAYVDEMQAYLTKMGEKGNEVARVMWGIDVFKEAVYFPLKSKEDFIYQANTPAETSSLKNDGMTKETRPHASNPIVLESFDDVWANHVEKMSKYHGFVIPIDNLNKLINYGTWMSGEAEGSERRFKPFGEQIDDVSNGVHNPRFDLYVSETPEALLKLNFTNGPLLMRNSKVKEILDKHPEMSEELLKKIPEAINDPVLIIKSKTHPTESVVVITDIMTSKGEMIVPVWIDQEGNYIDLDLEESITHTNFVASAYGRNIKALLEYANENEGFFYQSPQNKRVRQLLARNGLQLSTPLKISNSTISIPQESENVNRNFSTNTEMGSHSISTMLEARFGPGVNEYLNTFIKDLNGAKAQSGGLLGSAFNLLSKFKKTSVAASLSVVVQQPTAIIRALSEIDARYFVGMPKPEILNRKWERMKKYAPIVILKDIGGFDAGSGKQITEWINADTKRGVDKAMNKADDLTMYGAALGDRIGWASIWTAIEREVKAKQKLEYGSEAFYEAVGKRFTEVIVKTQVYDSTLSRSGFMRGKDGLMKMATAFMGEPTLSVNMMADAILQAKRGKIKKAKAVRVIASVYVATVAASVIKSLIYALRDDDEDESYAEKYLQALGGEMRLNLNPLTMPLTMLPIFRDVVSIFDGWDVERTDMALFADLKNAIDALNSDTKSTWRKIEDFAGAIAAFAGVPLKNVMRTAREIYNLIESLFDGIDGGDLGGAFLEGITGKEDGKRESMYNALISGDPERIEIYRESYDSEDKYLSAVKQALRECDPRVQRGVEGVLSGNYSVYNEMKADVRSEKHFDVKTVTNAFADEKEYVLGKLNDARKARREGNSEEFDKIVQKLIERGYSRSFILKKLK